MSALFVVTCGTFAYRSLLAFEQQFISLVGQNEEFLLRESAIRLSGNIAATQRTLNSAATFVDPKAWADPNAAKRFLEGRTFLRENLAEGLYLLDKSGTVLASVVGGPANSPRNLLPEERELAQRTALTGHPQLSNAYAAPQQRYFPILSMSAPVFKSDGMFAGTLLGSFALLDKNYAGPLVGRKVGQSGYLYLTTRDRIMLMHPKPERILTTIAKVGQNLGLDRALDQGFEGAIETTNSTGLHALATFVGVPSLDWVLASNFPMAEVREPLLNSLREMAIGAVIMTFLLFAVVMLLVRRVMRPVRQLTERLSDLGRGVPRPIDFPVGGELGIMAGAFNQMVGALTASEQARSEKEREVNKLNQFLEDRVRERTLALEHANAELQQTLEVNVHMQDELVRKEKQAALGRMVAGMAHELNTPIGNALLVVSGLHQVTKEFGKKAKDGVLKRSDLVNYESKCLNAADLAERSLTRAALMVTNFKQVALDQTAGERRTFDLGDTIRETLESLEHLIKSRPVKLYADLARGLEMDSYPEAVRQLVAIFYMNALGHGFSADAAGEIWITCKKEAPSSVVLVFKDTGRGITAEHIDKVFDPFFKTSMGLGGMGLGLSIAHNIVTGLLGGTMSVTSEPGQGAAFRTRFGRTSPAQAK